MSVCHFYVSVKEQIPGRNKHIKKTKFSFCQQGTIQYFMFKVSPDIHIFSDQRINYADSGKQISGMCRILKAEFNISFQLFRPEITEQSFQLFYCPGKSFFMDLICKKALKLFFFLCQRFYISTYFLKCIFYLVPICRYFFKKRGFFHLFFVLFLFLWNMLFRYRLTGNIMLYGRTGMRRFLRTADGFLRVLPVCFYCFFHAASRFFYCTVVLFRLYISICAVFSGAVRSLPCRAELPDQRPIFVDGFSGNQMNQPVKTKLHQNRQNHFYQVR